MTPEQERELERTTALRGFRYGLHDFLAEVDLEGLTRTNDKVEAEYVKPSLLDRKSKELMILAACIAMTDEVTHLQIHFHAAAREGATPEELYEAIGLIGNWISLPARVRALEAWRATFRPELPTIDRVIELR
jgi:alkylhydroperoxidase/carboxymuconolactone decarboxylase family protein YurZ